MRTAFFLKRSPHKALRAFGVRLSAPLYGALLAEAGFDVSVYARGLRLESLKRNGLQYKYRGKIRTAPIKVLSKTAPDDRYDFILLTVRENQLHAALEELRPNSSPTIVTMVNSLETYVQWEAICGPGRIIIVLFSTSLGMTRGKDSSTSLGMI